MLGAGPVGLLVAMLLKIRGFSVDICSLEPANSDRARLAEAGGARYRNEPDRTYDVVIEAAGTEGAGERGLNALEPNGVIVMLGAAKSLRSLAPTDPPQSGHRRIRQCFARRFSCRGRRSRPFSGRRAQPDDRTRACFRLPLDPDRAPSFPAENRTRDSVANVHEKSRPAGKKLVY